MSFKILIAFLNIPIEPSSKVIKAWNKDTVEDSIIHNHLEELSNGKLKVSSDQLPLSSSINLLKIKSKNGNGPKSNHKSRKRNNRKRY